MNIAPKSHDTSLEELLQNVNSGSLQLPEFQRNWTWDNERIKGIIGSLAEGYPMGAIMVLKYGNPDIKFKYRPVEGAEVQGVTPDSLILDGQQRLTSIYRSLFSKNVVDTSTDKGKNIKRWYYLSLDKCLENSVDISEAVVDVPEDRVIRKNFNRDIVLDLSKREYEIKKKMFPLNILFDNSEYMNWVMDYFSFYEKGSPDFNNLKVFQSEILNTIQKYELPVITLNKATPKEAVCRVFENVNTGGVSLTVFELVTATFAADGFDLREDWKNCQKDIVGYDDTLRTDLFDDVDETSFLTAVTLYSSYVNKINGKSGAVSCKKKDVLALSLDDYLRNKDCVLDGFNIARDFLLLHQYVFRKRDLPYSTQLIPLAAICAHLGRSVCNQPSTIEVLSKWYWCGIFGEMYGGANETRYANDIEDVINTIEGRESLKRTVNSAFFASTRLLTLQTRNSAAYKGVIALIYKAGSKDFIKGNPMNIVNSLQAVPDVHHIFPEAYCEGENIPRKLYNSVVNKTPILPETNRSIGGKAPSIDIDRILNNSDYQIDEDTIIDNIESNLIDYDLLYSDKFQEYFIDRAKKLLNLIESAMCKPVSDKSSEITINEFGASLE